FLLYATPCCFGQSSDAAFLIKENILKIENALLKKDTLALQELLHSDLTLGHSNGWIESKESLFEDLTQDNVSYSGFEHIGDVVFAHKSDSLIVTCRNINAYGTVNSYTFIAKL